MNIPFKVFTLYGNAHADKIFRFTLPAGADFSGADFKMRIAADSGEEIEKSTAAGNITVNGLDVTVKFEPDDTRDATWNQAVYDMFKMQHGRQVPVVRGLVMLVEAVTR
ncbi:hypothetical protein [Neisseria sp. S1]|uniref:hypothetical protein n=1 Tax=Neisseria sp. S1 TaxID=3318354 RepID=UPI003A8C121E